jgi:hypothetical protein
VVKSGIFGEVCEEGDFKSEFRRAEMYLGLGRIMKRLRKIVRRP